MRGAAILGIVAVVGLGGCERELSKARGDAKLVCTNVDGVSAKHVFLVKPLSQSVVWASAPDYADGRISSESDTAYRFHFPVLRSPNGLEQLPCDADFNRYTGALHLECKRPGASEADALSADYTCAKETAEPIA